MTTIIKRSRSKKNRGQKLMIPESKISECSEHKVKSNTGNILVNEKKLKEYSVKIYEIDPYFYEQYKKK